MSNCQKKMQNPKQLLKFKPYKSNFSSLVSVFSQRIQIPEKSVGWGGGVGVGTGSGGWGRGKAKMLNYKHEPSQNSCTQHIVFVTIYISKQKDH